MIMTKHLKYGGSTIARTMACPAWHRLAEDIPHGPVSDAAKRGTALHTVLEKTLYDFDLPESDFVGKVIDGVEMTPELLSEKISPALDAFDSLMSQFNINDYELEVFVEHPNLKDVGGTADFLGVSDDGEIVLLVDYKSGDGIIVEAKDNAQLLFYAWLAALDDKTKDMFEKCKKVVLVIVQPSDRNSDLAKVWEVDIKTLRAFGEQVLHAVVQAEDPYLEPSAGAHCQFCPVAAVCPARTGEASRALMLDVDDKNLASLVTGMQMVDTVEKWCLAVRKLAHEQMEQGVVIQGFKLVNKRGTRVWNDKEIAEDKARKKRKLPMDEIYNHDLLSPPKMEKLCKQKGVDFDEVFKDDISSVSSGTTIASEDDPRPEAVTIATMQRIANQTA